MNLRRLFGKSKGSSPSPDDPARILDHLRAALARRDGQEFVRLCSVHRDEIFQQFPGWLVVPEQYRSDNDAVMAFMAPVFRTAEYFESVGYPELMERLTGGANNPQKRWSRAFASANQLVESGVYDEAMQLLEGILTEMKGASGSAIDDIRPKVNGLLGIAQFRKGDSGLARRFTEAALAECRQIGDAEGIRVYTEHLSIISLSADSAAADGDMMKLRAGIVDAQKLSDKGWYHTSNQVLMGILSAVEQSADLEYRGKIYGLLGLNWFRLSDKEKALHYTELALAECRRTSDEEGLRIYGLNLGLILQGSAS